MMVAVPLDCESELYRGFSAYPDRIKALDYRAPGSSVLEVALDGVEENRVQLSAIHQRLVSVELAHLCGCGRVALSGSAQVAPFSPWCSLTGIDGEELEALEVVAACESCSDPELVGKVREAGLELLVRSEEVEAWCQKRFAREDDPTHCVCRYHRQMTADTRGRRLGGMDWYLRTLWGRGRFVYRGERTGGRRGRVEQLNQCRVCKQWWYLVDIPEAGVDGLSLWAWQITLDEARTAQDEGIRLERP